MARTQIITLLVASYLTVASAWFSSSLLSRSHTISQRRPHTCFSATSGDGSSDVGGSGSGSGSDDFMASLRTRVQEVTDRSTKIPIVVLDTMLPRQVFRIESSEEIFIDLIRTLRQTDSDGSTFGMVGTIRRPDGRQAPLKNGVEIEIVGSPELGPGGVRVELRGGRRLRIEGEVDTTDQGWTEARIAFMDSSAEEEDEENGSQPLSLARAMAKARELSIPNMNMERNKSLVDRWTELARENERQPGQIDKLLEDLGPIPHDTEPSECAFWVGALVNPLPGMGVAMEIRPALLIAKTAEERVQIALDGILASIRHMDGTKRMW